MKGTSNLPLLSLVLRLKVWFAYLFSLEDVSEVFEPQTLQELVDGHVKKRCRDKDVSKFTKSSF